MTEQNHSKYRIERKAFQVKKPTYDKVMILCERDNRKAVNELDVIVNFYADNAYSQKYNPDEKPVELTRE